MLASQARLLLTVIVFNASRRDTLAWLAMGLGRPGRQEDGVPGPSPRHGFRAGEASPATVAGRGPRLGAPGRPAAGSARNAPPCAL